MENWIVSTRKDVVYKIGEFLIQVTTIESMLENIYNEFILQKKKRDDFAGMMLGKKIQELACKIKIGVRQEEIKSISDLVNKLDRVNLVTRLSILKDFRNEIAHKVLEYDYVSKKVYLKGIDVDFDFDKHIAHAANLMTDLFIMLESLKDPKNIGYKNILMN